MDPKVQNFLECQMSNVNLHFEPAGMVSESYMKSSLAKKINTILPTQKLERSFASLSFRLIAGACVR
jgi:hypothetical protein